MQTIKVWSLSYYFQPRKNYKMAHVKFLMHENLHDGILFAGLWTHRLYSYLALIAPILTNNNKNHYKFFSLSGMKLMNMWTWAKTHTFNILTMKTEKQCYMLVLILLLSPPTSVWSEMNIVLFNLQETDLYTKYISWWDEFFCLSMDSETATNETNTDQHIAHQTFCQYISETSIWSCGKLKISSAVQLYTLYSNK
jgi:hypothetical protein